MVEFVSYNGAYPNLCSGTLVLRINGIERTLERCLSSGGSVTFDENWLETVTQGEWSVYNLPDDLEPMREEIEECINENIPYGCCGGCV